MPKKPSEEVRRLQSNINGLRRNNQRISMCSANLKAELSAAHVAIRALKEAHQATSAGQTGSTGNVVATASGAMAVGANHALTHLRKSAEKNDYEFSAPEARLLEKFPCPDKHLLIHIEVPEFTSLCPITGQPDFAKIIIDYLPGDWCVESKALKLYMMSFRNHGSFHESCVTKMKTDLVYVLQPRWMRVKGEFTPRGGIPFWPTAVYRNNAETFPLELLQLISGVINE